ncbi:MAG: hypothetical protein JXQ87_13765 [Bacteroidia bacterium]
MVSIKSWPNSNLGIAIVGILSMVLVYVATSPMFFTPKFKSETIIYVPLFVPARQMENQGIGFASDKEINGHIQILISGKMKDTLNTIFNLSDRYNVNTEEVGGMSQLFALIDGNVNIEKTRYSSVAINVTDADAEFAAKMANKIVELGDIIKEDLLMSNRKKAIDFAQKLEKDQLSLLDSITKIHDTLWETKERGEFVNMNHLDGLRQQMDREFDILIEKRLNTRKEKENLETPLPSSYVISEAVPSNSPIWPNRKMLAIAAFALVAGILWLYKMLRIAGENNS